MQFNGTDALADNWRQKSPFLRVLYLADAVTMMNRILFCELHNGSKYCNRPTKYLWND